MAAVATALQVRCTVCIPEGNSKDVVDSLAAAGGEVIIVKGKHYSDAEEYTSKLVTTDPNGFV